MSDHPPRLSDDVREGLKEAAGSIRRAPRLAATILRDRRVVAGDLAVGSILLLCAHFLLDRFDASGIGVVLPEVQKAFHLNLQGITTLASLTTFAALFVSLPFSVATDRTRRRLPYLAVATCLAGISVVFGGFATSVVFFGLSRVGVTLGLRVSQPVQQSVLADYAPVSARAGVYSVRQMATSVGGIAGPVIFGAVTSLFGWRAAFVVAAVPMVAIGAATLLLREPPRGIQERRAMGVADEADLAIEDDPPSWEESWETLKAIKSLRRLWWASPFLIGGLAALVLLQPLFLQQVFHLGPAARGGLGAVDEPFALLGLLLGVPVAARIIRGGAPERLFRLLGVQAVIVSALLCGVALAPDVAVVVGFRVTIALVAASIAPAFATLFSLILPPRARSAGFAVSAIWAAPGLLIPPVVGAIGDAYGLRVGLLVAVPFFLAGALIVASGGREFRADMQANMLRAMASLDERAARAAGRTKMLVCRGVEVAYGQVQVLFGVDLDIDEGEMVALLGTNGAGKSTLLKAISGTMQPTAGAILFDGRDITRAPAAQTAALRITHVPGGRGIFPSLTVAENLRVAAWLERRDPEHVAVATAHVLELFPALRARLHQEAGNLSGGEQQMLALGQALITRPKLLMIDELSLGLAPTVVQQLLDVVGLIHAQGTTVVLVEQSVNVALSVCQRAVFLEKGEVRYDGPAAGLLDREDILRAVFLGQATRREAAPARRRTRTNGAGRGAAADGGRLPGTRPRLDVAALGDAGVQLPVVLEVEGLEKHYRGITAVGGVDVRVHLGEVVGLIGANGAGKTTIMDLISGFQTPDAGHVMLEGTDITAWPAEARAIGRLGRSFQTARLFPSLTVAETIAVAFDRHLDVRDPLSSLLWLPAARDAEDDNRGRVEELIERMNLGAYRDKYIRELSTGTRRIVDLACSLAHRPKVLLLDEPSAGIAQRETEALAPLLLQLQREMGTSILVVEHDIPFIRAVSDRLIALEMGVVIAEGAPEQVLSDPRVIASYLGTSEAVIRRSGASRPSRPRRPVMAAAQRRAT